MKILHKLYVDKETGISVSVDTKTKRVSSSCGDSVEYYTENGRLYIYDALYSTPESIVESALRFFTY